MDCGCVFNRGGCFEIIFSRMPTFFCVSHIRHASGIKDSEQFILNGLLHVATGPHYKTCQLVTVCEAVDDSLCDLLTSQHINISHIKDCDVFEGGWNRQVSNLPNFTWQMTVRMWERVHKTITHISAEAEARLSSASFPEAEPLQRVPGLERWWVPDNARVEIERTPAGIVPEKRRTGKEHILCAVNYSRLAAKPERKKTQCPWGSSGSGRTSSGVCSPWGAGLTKSIYNIQYYHSALLVLL